MPERKAYLKERLNEKYLCPYCKKKEAHLNNRPILGPHWYVECDCGLRIPCFETAEEAVYQWQLLQSAFPENRPDKIYWLFEELKNDLNDYRDGNDGDYSLTYINIRHRLVDYLVAIEADKEVGYNFAPVFTQYEPAGDDNPFHVVRVSDKSEFTKEDADFVVDGVLKIFGEIGYDGAGKGEDN